MRASLAPDIQEADSFTTALKRVTELISEVKNVRAVQISSESLRSKIKEFVKEYFRILRPELVQYGIPTEELDESMQNLMRMANAYTSKSSYKRSLEKIRHELVELETVREHEASNLLIKDNKQGLNTKMMLTENKAIMETLERTVPVAAISYRQALEDLQIPRVSYRGTVAELREVLREVLDYLAPDKDVSAAQNFKLESGTNKPTMKQKTRFILRNRSMSATATETPEEAVSIVDEGIAKLVRATYNRGSLSTHTTGEGRPEALQIKMYLDTVLCELLEIK